jgi:hypothetical protein
MKRLMIAQRDFLVDDSAAEALIQYAAVLADARRADVVELTVVTADSQYARLSLLLATGTQLAATTIDSEVDAPDNRSVVDHMWGRIASLKAPREIPGDTVDHYVDFDADHF